MHHLIETLKSAARNSAIRRFSISSTEVGKQLSFRNQTSREPPRPAHRRLVEQAVYAFCHSAFASPQFLLRWI